MCAKFVGNKRLKDREHEWGGGRRKVPVRVQMTKANILLPRVNVFNLKGNYDLSLEF
jgi:hypothetical protein